MGWEQCDTIDLRYKDQVIASPKLAWKIPNDRALGDMNWVTAIMDSAPKDASDESVANALDTGIASIPVSTDNIPVPAGEEVRGGAVLP